MRIALDITPIFQDKPTGVSNYCASIVQALSSYYPNNDYVLTGVCPKGIKDQTLSQLRAICPSGIIKIFFVPQKTVELILTSLQVRNPRFVDHHIGAVDVFHQFDAYSLKTNYMVTSTVFDLSAYKYPHLHTPKNVSIQLKRLALVRKRSAHIFTISETIKREAVSLWDVPLKTVSVVYPPIDNRQILHKTCDEFACLRSNQILFDTLHTKKFILSVATREPRKNLDTLKEAYHRLSDRLQKKYPLVIVGAPGWGQNLKIYGEKSIYLTGYICDTCLEHIYSQSHLFVYSSIYEGFGMPIMEAMKFGIPVLCSKIPVFREISGSSAMFADTQDSQKLGSALIRALSLGKNDRSQLIKQGFLQAKKFSAKQSASVMVRAWNSLVQSSHENSNF